MYRHLTADQSKGPLVSVVIPCYKQAHFLPDALESVVAQTHTEIETIVVDDGSPDNVSDMLTRYPTVKCVHQQNQGLAGARNSGFLVSTGSYVVFLDADDRLTPNALEAHLRCFSESAESGFVVGDIDHITVDGLHAGSPRWPLLESNQYEALLRVNHVANTIAVMFRRQVLEQLGGFKPACSPAEDYELLLRAARLFPSRHHRTVVAQYRRYSAGLSRKGTLMLRAMNHVMRLQREQVKDDPVLLSAWRQGNAYWKDHFGAAAVKELLGYLRSGQLGGAARAGAALVRFVGFRILVIPWKRRRRLLSLLRQRPGVRQKAAPIHPVIPVAAGRKEQAPASKS
jgi:glycosyltransferase involved in cell wall biosynthesis